MERIFCATCEQFEPCACPRYQKKATGPKITKSVYLLGGALTVARFYWGTPREKRMMIQDVIDRFNKIKHLVTEQYQKNTQQKK